jgi:hypothetical protein
MVRFELGTPVLNILTISVGKYGTTQFTLETL